MHTVIKRGLTGMIAGAVATVPMTAVMIAAQRLGFLGEAPPRLMTDFAFLKAQVPIPEKQEELAIAGSVHFGFGSASGALFGILARPRSAPSGVLQGMAFGLALWFVSYHGWVPALHIMPPPEEDRPHRPLVMVLAHIVYGSVLGWIAGRFHGRLAE